MTDTTTTTGLVAEHGCGLCDAPIAFDGYDGPYPGWKCTRCDWWHTSKDCCQGFTVEYDEMGDPIETVQS